MKGLKTGHFKESNTAPRCVRDAPFGATAKIFRDRRVRFACEPTKLEPLKIRYFHIFDRGGNLFELASGLYCSEDKTAIQFEGWISARCHRSTDIGHADLPSVTLTNINR